MGGAVIEIALTNHLLGVVQVPGSDGVAKRPNEDLTPPTTTTMGCEIKEGTETESETTLHGPSAVSRFNSLDLSIHPSTG